VRRLAPARTTSGLFARSCPRSRVGRRLVPAPAAPWRPRSALVADGVALHSPRVGVGPEQSVLGILAHRGHPSQRPGVDDDDVVAACAAPRRPRGPTEAMWKPASSASCCKNTGPWLHGRACTRRSRGSLASPVVLALPGSRRGRRRRAGRGGDDPRCPSPPSWLPIRLRPRRRTPGRRRPWNKPLISAPEPSGWHHGCCRPGRETRVGKGEDKLCPHKKTRLSSAATSSRGGSRATWPP
jgi:hypothetical protein